MGRKTGMMFVALMSAGLLAGTAMRLQAGSFTYGTSATIVGISGTSLSTNTQNKAAYLAVAGEAANYLQLEGAAPASALLGELMALEKATVREVSGAKAAAKLCDLDLADLVLQRAAEFEKP